MLKIIAVVYIVSLLVPNSIYAAEGGGGDLLEFVPFQGRLVIVYFYNPSGKEELESLREGLPKLLIGELSGRRKVRVMAWEEVLQALQVAGWDAKVAPEKEEVLLLAHGLGGDAVLVGNYLPLGKGLRVFAKVYEVGSGRLLAEVEIGGPDENSPTQMAEDLASLVEGELLQPGPERTTPDARLFPFLGVSLSILNPGSGQFYVGKPWDGLFYYLVGSFMLANLGRYWGEYQSRPSDGRKAVVESWLWALIWLIFLASFDAYAETNIYNYLVQKYNPAGTPSSTEETSSSEETSSTEETSSQQEAPSPPSEVPLSESGGGVEPKPVEGEVGQ